MGVLVITIDGPAAAGKTTLATALCRSLQIGVLNTGALYRAATWVMRRDDLGEAGPDVLLKRLQATNFDYQEVDGEARVLCDGVDITAHLTDPALTRDIKKVADEPVLRRYMNDWQRAECGDHWMVTEGRDQGTDVFPEAAVKIFLTASLDVRVDRRLLQLTDRGVEISRDTLLVDFNERDLADRSRPMGALREPEGALILESSNLDRDATLTAALNYINERIQEEGLPELPASAS